MGFFGDFQFEPRNFGLGVLAGWVTAFAAYQARGMVRSLRQSASAGGGAQQYGVRASEGRYSRELIQFCEAHHLVGGRVPFSKVLIEPRFLPPAAFAAPPDDDVSFDVLRVVPRIHDHPYLHQPYNIQWASLDDLGYGDRAVALLGLPGSGRTSALLAIALWALGQVDFAPPKDSVTLRIEAEERALKADERANRIKERLLLEERARERLAEEQGIDPGLKKQEQRIVASPLRRLSPVYVHLANITPTPDRFGKQADPAEPLLRGVQQHVGYVTSKTYPSRFYERLDQGRLLILIDGFDDLTEAEQRARLPWLAALIQQYRRNFFIVAGPAYGYGNLLRAGLSPVYLRPWDDNDIARAAQLWAAHWGAISGKRRDQPSPDLVTAVAAAARGLSALEVCLKLHAAYAGEAGDHLTLADTMRLYLDEIGLGGEQLLGAATAAALQLDEGLITPARLAQVMQAQGSITLATPAPPPAEADGIFAPGDDDADVDALFASVEDASDDALLRETSPAPAPTTAAPIDKKQAAQNLKTQTELLAALQRLGLLTRFQGEHYRFRHLPTAAYLASLTFKTAPAAHVPALLTAKAGEPAWRLALAYAAGHMPVEAALEARLNAHPDVLLNHLFETARWLAYAGDRANWRPTLMKRLGNLFVAPAQYPLVRERAAAALIGTRDRSALVIFQRGLTHPDPDVRRLSCLGVGVLREPRAVSQVAALMDDKNAEVALAAALALGAIGTDEAYEEMALALTSGSEPLRQVVAEAFANLPEPGYETLYEAVTADDMLLRRAAIFGLRRSNKPWALIAIFKAFLDDQQWYVRSAAQQAFIDLQENRIAQGLRGYPQPEAIPWLREHTSGGETPPQQALIDALTQGGPVLQALSAQAIGQLDMAENISDLYQALLYREPVVRDSAHRALAELQSRIGLALPAPA